MALNGTFYGTTSNQYIKPKIIWSATQSVTGNYSRVTATLYYSRTNSGYTTSGTWSGSLTVNGSAVSGSKAVEITYNSDTQVISGTVTVYHDTYGKKTLTISAAGSISGTSLSSTSISTSVTLDTIPRASTVSATGAYIGEKSTVSVSVKSDAYTHSIAYQFGSLTGYLTSAGGTADTIQRFTAGSVPFTVPDSFYAQIPNSPSGVCTLTCKTWSGTTQIGDDQTATFTATARQSVCKPAVSGTVVDTNEKTKALTGDENTLIRYMSNAKCTITASGQHSASIRSKTVDGVSVTDSRVIEGIEADSVVFAATDSRGYTTGVTKPVPLIPYVKLTATVTGKRTDPTSGNATLTVKGNFYSGSLGTVDNTLKLTCQIGSGEVMTLTPVISNGGYSVSVELAELEYTQSHTVTVVASDALDTVTKTFSFGPGVPVFDWGQNDFSFHVPVTAPSLNGIYAAKLHVSQTDTFTLITDHATLDRDNYNRHAFFIFGMANIIPVRGILSVGNGGAVVWDGSGAVTATAVDPANSGAVTVTLPMAAYDYFIIISARQFAVTA